MTDFISILSFLNQTKDPNQDKSQKHITSNKLKEFEFWKRQTKMSNNNNNENNKEITDGIIILLS